MSSLNKHGRLKFNPDEPNANCSNSVGAYLLDGYGLQLTSTMVDGDTQALDVFLHGFDQTISNEDGYLYVDFVNDLLNEDGYLQVSIQDSDITVDVDIFQYEEDTQHVSGDIGDFMLSIKLDDINGSNAAYLANANGDYQGLFTNTKGELYTHDTDAYGALLQVIDGLNNISFDPAITTGDGYLYVTVTNPTPSASEFAEDTLHVTGDVGTFGLSIKLDDINGSNAAFLAGTNGDYQGFFTNTKGELYVHDTDAYGALLDVIDGLDTINFDPSLVNQDGYLIVDIGDAVNVSTTTELEVVDCPLPDGYTGLQSFIADSYRRLWTNDAAAVGGKTTVATVTSTAALLVPMNSRPGRVKIIFQNKGDAVVYVGFDSGVTADDTATGGFEVDCGDVLTLDVSECLDLYVVTPSGETSTVKIIELA